MPPYLEWYVGRASIVAFAQAFSDPGAPGFRGELRGVPTQANRQPAVAWYLRPPPDATYQALSLDVLRIEDGIVAEIIGFVLPDLFPAFGLAPTLEHSEHGGCEQHRRLHSRHHGRPPACAVLARAA